MNEGDTAPTAKAVAERASVSVRLVFHHFEDMEALYRMALAEQASGEWAEVREVAPSLAVAERIDRTVRQRAKLFDAIAPLRRAVTTIALRREDVEADIDETDQQLRGWIEQTFERELAAARKERRDLLDALDVAASFETWDRLRHGQGLSAVAARRAVTRTLSALLGR
ncbi:MAG: TetR/AcrR family transcriptional regulator [Solirubrobacteraceae bacterium]